MRASSLRALLLAVLALPLLVLAPAPAGAATVPAGQPPEQIGVRLLDAPVARRDDPRAHVYVVDHVQPGTTLRRRVEVTSTLRRPARVELYPGAAVLADGAFTGLAGRTADELSTWTRMSPSALVLPPGGRAVVEVVVAVPSGAAGGERYGVLWAEHRAATAAGTGVVGVSRVGVRTYLSVGGPVEPASDFVVEALTAARGADGTAQVRARVRNTGGRALDLSGELRLSGGPGGTSAGPFPVQGGTSLAPGSTAAVTATLDAALPDGPWDARLELRSGRLVRAVTGRLRFPDAGAQSAPVTPQDATPAPPPEAAGSPWDRVLEVLGGLLAVLLVLLLVRRRREQRQDGPAPVQVPPPAVAPLPPPLPRPRRAPVRVT